MNKRVGRHHIRPLCPVVKGFKLRYWSITNFFFFSSYYLRWQIKISTSTTIIFIWHLWYLMVYIDGLVMTWTLLLHREKAAKTQETTINACQREQLYVEKPPLQIINHSVLLGTQKLALEFVKERCYIYNIFTIFLQ